MTPLSHVERTHALTRIAGALDRQRDEARSAGADLLAFLIAKAIEEVTNQLDLHRDAVIPA